jgi:hypothetical protein
MSSERIKEVIPSVVEGSRGRTVGSAAGFIDFVSLLSK